MLKAVAGYNLFSVPGLREQAQEREEELKKMDSNDSKTPQKGDSTWYTDTNHTENSEEKEGDVEPEEKTEEEKDKE